MANGRRTRAVTKRRCRGAADGRKKNRVVTTPQNHLQGWQSGVKPRHSIKSKTAHSPSFLPSCVGAGRVNKQRLYDLKTQENR